MNKEITIVTAQDGREIKVSSWITPNAKAYLHICHGMAEHIDRYEEFAKTMSDQGLIVFYHNHRGHGANERLGHYADKEGWSKAISDIKDVQSAVIKDNSLPVFLFAHSMGSFIAQGFAIRHGDSLAGLILSGTNYQNPTMYYIGRAVAKLEAYRLGMGTPSKIMDTLSFASFNKHFKPTRTDFDWLSRDSEQVDEYIRDPFCGFPCSGETWTQLLTGLIEISNTDNLARIPIQLPIYIFGGDQDPVGRMGKGIPALAQKLRQIGHDNVITKLYKGGRHEMLNETCKAQVHSDVSDWIKNTLI